MQSYTGRRRGIAERPRPAGSARRSRLCHPSRAPLLGLGAQRPAAAGSCARRPTWRVAYAGARGARPPRQRGPARFRRAQLHCALACRKPISTTFTNCVCCSSRKRCAKLRSAIRGKAQIAPFREQLAAMVAAHTENDVAAFMEANYRFRAAWLEIVPNRRLLRAIELYADHVRYLRALTLGDRERARSGIERPKADRSGPVGGRRRRSERRDAGASPRGEAHPARRTNAQQQVAGKRELQSRNSLWRLLEHAVRALAGSVLQSALGRICRLRDQGRTRAAAAFRPTRSITA